MHNIVEINICLLIHKIFTENLKMKIEDITEMKILNVYNCNLINCIIIVNIILNAYLSILFSFIKVIIILM